MIFIVIIIFGLLLFFVLGTDSFRKYAKKVSRKRRQNKLENNEPLKGYEKCSPQYQAYMRKQIAAGKANIPIPTSIVKLAKSFPRSVIGTTSP